MLYNYIALSSRMEKKVKSIYPHYTKPNKQFQLFIFNFHRLLAFCFTVTVTFLPSFYIFRCLSLSIFPLHSLLPSNQDDFVILLFPLYIQKTTKTKPRILQVVVLLVVAQYRSYIKPDTSSKNLRIQSTILIANISICQCLFLSHSFSFFLFDKRTN